MYTVKQFYIFKIIITHRLQIQTLTVYEMYIVWKQNVVVELCMKCL